MYRSQLDGSRYLVTYLKKQYQQTRFNEDYQNYIGGLKKEFNYRFDEEVFAALLSVLDSTQTTDALYWATMPALTPSSGE